MMSHLVPSDIVLALVLLDMKEKQAGKQHTTEEVEGYPWCAHTAGIVGMWLLHIIS